MVARECILIPDNRMNPLQLFYTLCFFLLTVGDTVAEPLRFNRDVLPILSDHCFQCHGPDKGARKADLRLDHAAVREQEADSGLQIIEAGKPDDSELIYRVTTDDDDEVMPPPDFARQLNSDQKAVLAQWIAEGAKWEKHWAFESVIRPDVVPREGEDPIDSLIDRRLEQESILPNSPAAPETWLRRVSLDLAGLPPEPNELDRFLVDLDFEAAVDRLLKSHRFGERMAWDWLEASRYADTHGYQKDNLRSMWAWRDWVVSAYNRNLRFDQFTIEQLAGDLLPDPSTSQLIATGFNRNHRINAEAGAIDEEYRTEYVMDRVDTTATVWMGLTAACARCHDHKFDPLTQREFFEFFAFFNNIEEKGSDGVAATSSPEMQIDLPGSEAAVAAKEAELRKRENRLNNAASSQKAEFAEWKKQKDQIYEKGDFWLVVEPEKVAGDNPGSTFTALPDDSILFGGANPLNDTHRVSIENSTPLTIRSIRLEALPHDSLTSQSLSRSFNGDFLLSEMALLNNGEPVTFASATATIETSSNPAKNAIDGKPLTGWSVGGGRKSPAQAIFVLPEPINIERNDKLEIQLAYLSREEQYFVGRFRISLGIGSADTLELPQSIYGSLASRDEKILLEEFCETSPSLQPLRRARNAARDQLSSAEKAAVTRVMIMREREGEPRETHLLHRGLYDQPGEVVTAGVPAFLSPALPQSAPANRLTLARWLVSPEHPLTARVAVNRYWQQLFGTGLVKTSEDFGRQGERPSHPELLDYLASEFVDSGWDIKALLKRLVLTDAYRRSSTISEESAERDPANRLLSRGPRNRLPAPAIRDQALFFGGVLVEKMGGPPVRPWQPAGLWEAVAGVNSNTTRYVPDSGEALYRRSLYTLWKRGVPPPNMILFDAAAREACTVNRQSTNTPLQALVTLNDPTFSVSAVAFAARELESSSEDRETLRNMWRRIQVREIPIKELSILQAVLKDQRRHYTANPDLAAKRASVIDSQLDPVRLATFTEIAEILLNLDTTLTNY